jgi:hypothetical protein
MARVSFITSRWILSLQSLVRLIHDFFVVACRLCGREFSSVRCEPQDHQLYALHDWLRGFCHVPEEGSPQTTIRPILLGAYDALAHRGLEVGIYDRRYRSSV